MSQSTGISRSVVVPAEHAGERLDQIAAKLLPEFSRSRLQAWIAEGRLTVGGETRAPKSRLRGGEKLCLEAVLEPAVPVEPEAMALSIVHEDQHVLVIDKPAGLVVHPGAGNPSGTLQNALLGFDAALASLPRAGLVHRLDKDTSGLLVVARTLPAQKRLSADIEARAVHRTYVAVCQRVLTGGGMVDAPIGRHPRDRKKMTVREDGREARTVYRVIERFRAHTLLRVTLDTGRTHQIRVHMAHIRAPLVGDPVYGGRPRLPRAPDAELVQTLRAFRRQALHATRLEFAHPATGQPARFESPPAPDIAHLLEVLRRDADTSA
jgi:23S rRNA pseudouridine1911/1915/1917 synthase